MNKIYYHLNHHQYKIDHGHKSRVKLKVPLANLPKKDKIIKKLKSGIIITEVEIIEKKKKKKQIQNKI